MRYYKRFFLTTVLCAPLSLWAGCLEQPQGGCSIFSLSPSLGYYKYAEPSLMNIQGPLVGIEGEYQYISTKNIVLWINGGFAFVNGRYDGSSVNLITLERTPLTFHNDKSYILNLSPKIGYRISFYSKGVSLLPYIGAGYRYLYNNTTDNVEGGYERISNYFYVPIGLQLTKVWNKWIWQSQIEFDIFAYGYQYSGTDGGFTNAQHDGYGANAYTLFGRKEHMLSWLIGPYIQYWNIKQSEFAKGDTRTWYEPENYTINTGVMVKFIF
ncbi:hypothetical protein [Fangia hongkongensis]|uniref:hypothetical protein n=1 Tax=Fangia hongkongensis TaxID=270495 RepID=UPI000367A5F0|nr:hypothetical protein [Fangia hongkongensis]MBK2123695.1 hypothetical protein [Fangia hongkongensis]